METESVITSLPAKKRPGPEGFTGGFSHTLEEELTPLLLELFQNIEKERTIPNSFCEATNTLILKRDKDITRGEKLQTNIPCKSRYKNSPQNISESNPTANSKDRSQEGFLPGIQGWPNVRKSITVTHHINRIKGENMIISADAEKAFDKTQYHFVIKSLRKPESRRKLPQPHKGCS